MSEEYVPRIPGFVLGQKLGEGATSIVYHATPVSGAGRVALKVMRAQLAINDEIRRRFHREARLLSQATHKNVAGCLGYGIEDGQLWIATELFPHGNMAGLIEKARKRQKRMRFDRLTSAAKDCLSGLAYLHQNNILHRDIKPANIFFRGDGSAVLGDLGHARQDDSKSDAITQMGAFVGSMPYLPPEVFRRQPVTPRTDLFCLGLSLFEAMCLEHPNKGNPLGPDFDPPDPLVIRPKCPSSFRSLLLRMMQADPDRRPASAIDAFRILTSEE